MDADHLLSKLRDEVKGLQPDSPVDPAGLLNVLSQWETERNEQARQQARDRDVARLRAFEDRTQREKFIEIQIALVSATFDKAVAYTNVVMIAGYASFFALWSLVRDLDQPLNRLAALCMLVSVGLFVSFEFVKMVYLGRVQLRRAKQARETVANAPFEEVKKEYEQMEADLKKTSVRFHIFWVIIVPPTAAIAVVAMALLASDLARALLTPR